MIEPGVYTGIFQSIEVGKSSKGTPCVATVWHIEAEDTDRTIYTYITKTTKKHSFKKLESIGFNGDFENPEVTVQSVELVCRHEEWDGETRERWEFASWGGAAGVEPAEKKAIRELNAMWKKDMGAPSKAKKKTPKNDTAPPPPEKPKPKPEEPPEPKADVTTPRTIAWQAFLEHKASEEAIEGLENGKSAKAAMEWASIIAEAIPSKDEEDFTDEDWENVKLQCETPY